MKKQAKKDVYAKVECSLILIDLSGFTQLVYHASYKEEIMQVVIRAMHRLFTDAFSSAANSEDLRIVNTTGDGFIAMATGRTPSRTAMDFAQQVRTHFEDYVRSMIEAVPFRQRAELRIALHHGHVYEFELQQHGDEVLPIFISDDINLLSRVINGQVARRFGVGVTRSFYRRITMIKGDLPAADEVILDRNRYPEQIEVYKVPLEIPELRSRKRKG